MTAPVRPTFTEGQVLAAADLTALVDHARGQQARHERYLHDWGIATGLTLTTEGRTDPASGDAYVQVTLQPGVAVDGTGREVVVPAAVPLQEADFAAVNGADPATESLYPVFLAGLDQAATSQPLVAGSTPAGRIQEGYQVIFGRLGDESTLSDLPDPTVDSGPGDGTDPWPVLLGFVRWKGGHIVATAPTSGRVGRRYAGVRADTVAARSGRLALRPDPEAAIGRPTLMLDGESGLAFGRLNSEGSVDPLVNVSPTGDVTVAGNITVAGSISGVTKLGLTAMASGRSSDGMLLPLPAGVTQKQVDGGAVTLHVHVTPRLDLPPQLGEGTWVLGPTVCDVDTDRRVLSRVRWCRIDAQDAEVRDVPAPVDFVVIAAAPPATADTAGGQQ